MARKHSVKQILNGERRNQVFDLLRILFAVLVLLAHAFELTDGNHSRELLAKFTKSNVSFGTLGVDGFFLLSGYLIVRSWVHHPELLDFLQKRFLRIVPGYLIAVLLSTLVVGLLAPGVKPFFSHLGTKFLRSVLELQYPKTPPVLPGAPYASVNGALWTISYEFRCYLLVALAGVCGLLKRRYLWLSFTAVLIALMSFPEWTDRIPWSMHLDPFLGVPTQAIRMTGTFALGACFYLFFDEISFRPALAAAACIILVLAGIFAHDEFETFLILCGGYLMYYLARSEIASRIYISQLPDISYGVYLYGWPVEILWIWYAHSSPMVVFAGSTAICLVLGWLSWHFVERPVLKLKRRPTAALAAAS